MVYQNMKKIIISFLFLILALPALANAQDGEIIQDTQNILKAEVLEVLEEGTEVLPSVNVKTIYQKLRVQILEGEKKGESILIENDYLNLKKGEKFYLMETIHAEDGKITYVVHDKYRLPVVYFFIGIFILCV